MMATDSTPRFRPLRFGVTEVTTRPGANGVLYVRATQDLQPHPVRLTDRLAHWAETTPDRTWMAQRVRNADGSLGDWRHISYREAWASARRIAQALLDRKLSADRPVVMLSENDLEHALLSLGCLVAGVPQCTVSAAYSTVSKDYDKLRHAVNTLTPGLVFASSAERFGPAIEATVGADVEVALIEGTLPGRSATPFSALLAAEPTPAVDAAHAAITRDSIAKFMFTSGSTKSPKAVIITHGMWTANMQQMNQSMPVLTEEDLVLVDWLPWNHTFGGNHNFGIVIYNGGTLYLDEGRPTPAGMAETIRNLREIAPTVYFNVPTGFEVIAHTMKTDAQLRKNLLSRVKMFFFAAAALSQPIWDALFEVAEQEVGERIVMNTGLGMTEGCPFCLAVNSPFVQAGDIGVPTPGLELKLVPIDGKTEVRYRGPNITQGYWRNAEATQEAFDEEGFYCSGDAVKWIDEADHNRGLKFDGRIAEDFKLSTGTFVSVGPMRAKIIAACAPYVQDAVITGINLKEVGALLIPTPHVRTLAGLPEDASLQQVLESAPVQQHFQNLLNQLAAQATGSATRVARMHLMAAPPSLDKGEITDKGSINQRAVLKHRASLVEAMHDGKLPFTLVPQQ
ncbi:feruloyl-CoA synthase [Acidovorax sp. M2(2025)]|uniref:feruloyl-CoA synthase n=1 Tax=Acidovorax sp. M2(2025) TaxID=3411355 RepID=UPI003BF49666